MYVLIPKDFVVDLDGFVSLGGWVFFLDCTAPSLRVLGWGWCGVRFSLALA